MLDDMLCIYECEDAVQAHVLLHEIVGKECLGNWCRVGETSCLDHHPIQRFVVLLCILDQLFEPDNEITSDSTANATIVHLDNVFFFCEGTPLDKAIVDAYFTELILDHCNSLS